MKDNIQTILNVCFAISITAFIYQNNSLKDDVKTLKGYAQLDTDKAWDRMDKMEAETTMIKERVGIEVIPESEFGGEPVYWTVNERLTSYGLKVLEIESTLDELNYDVGVIKGDVAILVASALGELGN